MSEVIIKSLAFEGPENGPDRGFTVKAFYLAEPSGEALVEIKKEATHIGAFSTWPTKCGTSPRTSQTLWMGK